MKNLFTYVIACLMLLSLSGHTQVFTSGFENWTNNKPDDWVGAKTSASSSEYAEYTTNVHGGTKALQLINTTTSHKRFTTQALVVTSNSEYTITFWARGQGQVRTGLFDGRPGTGYADYNAYIDVNSTSWTQYTQSIITVTDTSSAEFILSFRSTNATNDHLQIDDVSITAGVATIDTVTIYDIQYTSDPSGNSPYAEMMVHTSGVITAFSSDGYYIQDGPGAWNGVYVYDNSNTVAEGDSVSLTGKVKEYFGLTEITSVSGFTTHASGLALPEPAYISVAEVNTEAYEGVLVKVGGVKCTNTNAGYGMWVVAQGNDTCKVDNTIFSYTPVLNALYDIVAVINYSFDEFRLSPRRAADIQTASGMENNQNAAFLSVYPNPADEVLIVSTDFIIHDIKIFNLQGRFISGQNTNSRNFQIDISTLPAGLYLLQLNDGIKITTKRFIKD